MRHTLDFFFQFCKNRISGSCFEYLTIHGKKLIIFNPSVSLTFNFSHKILTVYTYSTNSKKLSLLVNLFPMII